MYGLFWFDNLCCKRELLLGLLCCGWLIVVDFGCFVVAVGLFVCLFALWFVGVGCDVCWCFVMVGVTCCCLLFAYLFILVGLYCLCVFSLFCCWDGCCVIVGFLFVWLLNLLVFAIWFGIVCLFSLCFWVWCWWYVLNWWLMLSGFGWTRVFWSFWSGLLWFS